MSILEMGCLCPSCAAKRMKELNAARKAWINGQREITFEPYHYTCGDGCCSEYGTNVYINGFQICTGVNGDDPEFVLEALFEFLGVKNVNINYEVSECDDST